MDFSFSEDQEALRGLAREIFEGEAGHECLKAVRETKERIARELLAKLARANLLGVAIPETHGGSGLGITEVCLLLEEAGRAVAPVPLHATLVLGALPIARFGSQAQRERFLPRVVAGQVILTAALVESGGAQVRAEREGGDFRLSGACPFVPAAHVAERVLVPARTGDGVGLFLVDPSGAGASQESSEMTHEEIHPTLTLRDAPVPAEDVLGGPADGAEILAWLRERALLGLCAMQLGVAGRALEMTATYTTERRQFDRPIGSFQAVHQRAGDAYVDLQAMKLTYWRALHLVAREEPAAEALAIAKYWAAEGGARITYAAQHLHGGIGVDTDYPLHRYYLWARYLGITLGSAAEQVAALGEALAAA